MKSIKYHLLLFLLLGSFTVFAQKKTFRVEGTITGSGVTKLYFTLSNFQRQPNAKAQMIPVKDGKFSFDGNITEPVPAFLSLTEKIDAGPDQPLQFILDAGNTDITIKDKLSSATVKGSKAHNDFQKFNAGQLKFTEVFTRLNAEAQKETEKGVSPDSLQMKYGPVFSKTQAELIKFQETFVKQNPDAYISLLLLPQFGQLTHDYIKADSLFNSLTAEIKSGKAGKEIHEHLKKEKKTSLGALAPDFSLADSAGNKIALSSLKGKYVLLDFWASWCGPCRQENPNVVNAFQTFKNKGFTVFGVSLDREKKNWLNAIKADQLTWSHVSDLKYWASEAAVLYGITAIPRNFLLDPKGKIIARDLRGPALIDKLNELFVE